MITLPKLVVQTFSLNHLDLSWLYTEDSEDTDQYSFYIYKAGAETGPWTLLNPIPLIDEYKFRDSDVNLSSGHAKYFYKVKIVNQTTGEETETKATSSGSPPSLIGLEIARKNTLYLEQNGRRCYIYTQKKWGARCPACYDKTLKKTTKSRCLTCFNTGWAGGYHKPIVSFMNVVVPQENLQQMESGDTENIIAESWLSNFPLLDPRDVIIDNENKRWRVLSPVEQSKKLGFIVSQKVRLFLIPPGDIEYQLPIYQDDYKKFPSIEHHYRRFSDYYEGVTPYDLDNLPSQSTHIDIGDRGYTIPIIPVGPQGPPGPSGVVDPVSGDIYRDGDNDVERITLENGQEYIVIRDANNYIIRIIGTEHTWIFIRDVDNIITRWEVIPT